MKRTGWLLPLLCWFGCSYLPVHPPHLPQRAPQERASLTSPNTSSWSQALHSGSPFKPLLNQIGQALRDGRLPDQVNHVGFLESGEDALLARLHLIEHAVKSIDYQTFIWVNDESGQVLANALLRAAQRGVSVRILVDYIGIAKDAKALALMTKAHPNLSVRVYRPTARTLERGHLATLAYALTNFKGANQRMHNKIMAVDGVVSITGGRNVENSYFDHALSMNFKDRDVLIAGPVSLDMVQAFDAFWDFHHTVPAQQLRDVARAEPTIAPLLSPVRKSLTRIAQQANDRAYVRRTLVQPMRLAQSMTFISDLPGKNGALHLSGGGLATTHILGALDEAQSQIWLQSPYMVLGRPGIRFFKKLRKRHPDLDIHVSTNSFGSTDNLIAYAGNVRLRDRYVHQLGLNIGEYRPWPADLQRVLPNYDWLYQQSQKAGERKTFLCIHAKSFVVDDKLAFVGSYNLDPRSAHLNTESGVLIRDPAIARTLREMIERDLQPNNCWTVAPRAVLKTFTDINVMTRDLMELSPLDVSILDSTSGFELKPGEKPIHWSQPDFYRRYRDLGSFPGGDGPLGKRELKGRLLKFSTRSFDSLL